MNNDAERFLGLSDDGRISKDKPMDEEKRVSLMVPFLIVVGLIVLIVATGFVAVFLPFGIPLLISKLFRINNQAINNIMTIISYIALFSILLLLFALRKPRLFFRILAVLVGYLLLNFVGCQSMGKFIDG